MSWEQHRYAVERARDLRRKLANEINEENQAVSLQGEAQGGDAELLNELADFLRSLEGSKAGQWQEDAGAAFVADWNKAIADLSNFCARYDLPKPDMIFHPKWQAHMSYVARQTIGSPLIYAGVRVRFGMFQSMDVFRP